MRHRWALQVLAVFSAVSTLYADVPSGAPVEEGSARVVGGEPAGRAVTWFALLHPAGRPAYYAVCGGTLVSERHVVTAAHCIRALQNRPAVSLGTYNRCARRESGRREFAVARYVVHPQWVSAQDGGDDLNDIAVLTLRRAATGFQTAALPSPQPASGAALVDVPPDGGDAVPWEPEAAGRSALVAGFGERRQNDENSQPCDLNVATVRVLSRGACINSAIPTFYAQQASLLCAGRRGGGVDTCQGDSGGPLVVQKGDRSILIGVVAFGYGCGQPGTPGLYTRVASFLPWLNEQMGKPQQNTRIITGDSREPLGSSTNTSTGPLGSSGQQGFTGRQDVPGQEPVPSGQGVPSGSGDLPSSGDSSVLGNLNPSGNNNDGGVDGEQMYWPGYPYGSDSLMPESIVSDDSPESEEWIAWPNFWQGWPNMWQWANWWS